MPLLSEALTATRIHWRILAVSWAGWLAVFLALMVLVWTPALCRDELGLDDGAVRWVKAVAIGATGFGGLLFGLLGDRSGRRTAIRASLAVYGAGLLASAAAGNLAGLVAAAAVAGLGIGGQWAAGQMLVGETVPPRLRGRFGALSQSGAPLGLGLAALLVFQLGPVAGWRVVAAIAAAPAIVLLVAARGIPESDVWLSHRTEVGDPGRAFLGRLAGLLEPGIRGIFGRTFLLTLLNMAAYWFTVTWLPDFLAREWRLDLAKSGLWTLAFVAGSLTGYLGYGVVSDRIGRRTAFSVFAGIMALSLGILTLLSGVLREEPRLILGFAFTAGIGTGTWSGFGPLYAELFPTALRTTASGLCMNVTRGVQFLAPLLVLAVGGARLGPGIALAALFALLAALAVWWLPETRGGRLPDAATAPGGSPGGGT